VSGVGHLARQVGAVGPEPEPAATPTVAEAVGGQLADRQRQVAGTRRRGARTGGVREHLAAEDAQAGLVDRQLDRPGIGRRLGQRVPELPR
jgi:hypothetical protein